MKRIIFLLLGACLCACGRYGCGVPAGYEPLLDAALAGCPHADSLRHLLRQTPREQREGMAFLIAHMPRGDRDTMRLDLLRELLAGQSTRCVGDLMDPLFQRKLDGHQVNFAVGETVAHLNRLHELGEIDRLVDDADRISYALRAGTV